MVLPMNQDIQRHTDTPSCHLFSLCFSVFSEKGTFPFCFFNLFTGTLKGNLSRIEKILFFGWMVVPVIVNYYTLFGSPTG